MLDCQACGKQVQVPPLATVTVQALADSPPRMSRRRRSPLVPIITCATLVALAVAAVRIFPDSFRWCHRNASKPGVTRSQDGPRIYTGDQPPVDDPARHPDHVADKSNNMLGGGLDAPHKAKPPREIKTRTRKPSVARLPDSNDDAELHLNGEFQYAAVNGNITITKYTGPGGAVTIPDKITGMPVTGIGYNAFGNGVTSIGESAFEDCTELTSVTIGKSVTRIGNSAFNGCEDLKFVVFTGNAPAMNAQVFDKISKDFTIYYS